MTVVAALEAELATMPADVAESAIAATALVLAAELDSSENSATSKSMCARALNESVDKLRALIPPDQTESKLDEITKRRQQRLDRRSAS